MAYNKPNNYYEVINDIVNSANIVDVISHYITLKKKGTSYFGLCPFHNDNHPSLSVSPKKKIFKCFVCGVKGNVISFVQQYEKISYFQAVKKVAELIGYDLSKLSFTANDRQIDHWNEAQQRLVLACKRADEIFEGQLYKPENKKAVEYLYKRGLNDKTIKYFHLGYAPNDDHSLINWMTNKENILGSTLSANKKFNENELIKAGLITDEVKPILMNRITFPIFTTNNTLVGFSGRDISNRSEAKYLHSPSTSIFNKSTILYNFNNVNKNNPEKIIIVEGFMDCIAYHVADHINTVATMGTALTSDSLNLLANVSKLKTIILSFDNDNAGVQATINNGKTLLENGFKVSVVNYDKIPYKDADEILSKLGKVGIDNIVNNRVDFLSYLISKAFKPNLPSDEKLDIVNALIEYIVQYGDISLRSIYLKQIAELTGFNAIDLEYKYDELKKQAFEKARVYIANEKTKSKSRPVSKGAVSDKDIDAIANADIEEEEPLPIDERLEQKYLQDYHGSNYQLCRCYEQLIYQTLAIPSTILIFSQTLDLKDNSQSLKEIGTRGAYLLQILKIFRSLIVKKEANTCEELIDKSIKFLKDSKPTKEYYIELTKFSLQWLYDFKEHMSRFLEKDIVSYEDKFESRIKQTLRTIVNANYHRNIAAKVLEMSVVYNSTTMSNAEKAARQSEIQAKIAEINHMHKKVLEGNK